MAKETTSKTSNNKVRSGRRKTGQVNTSKLSTGSSTRSVQAPVLTHEQISERAKAIWQDRECVSGLDEQNWHEAETQLKTELGIH